MYPQVPYGYRHVHDIVQRSKIDLPLYSPSRWFIPNYSDKTRYRIDRGTEVMRAGGNRGRPGIVR